VSSQPLLHALSSRAPGAGLVEHTAQMMRVAEEIAAAYPQLNLDLLVAGILFQATLGKLWGECSARKWICDDLRRVAAS